MCNEILILQANIYGKKQTRKFFLCQRYSIIIKTMFPGIFSVTCSIGMSHIWINLQVRTIVIVKINPDNLGFVSTFCKRDVQKSRYYIDCLPRS